MNKGQAQELAARIMHEAPGTTAVALPEEAVLWCEDFYINVNKTNVITMAIRSDIQWQERKHLLNKWGSHESGADQETQHDQTRTVGDDQQGGEK